MPSRKSPPAQTNRKNLRKNGRRETPSHLINAHQMVETATAAADAVPKGVNSLALRSTKVPSKARAVTRAPAGTGLSRNESAPMAGRNRSAPQRKVQRRLTPIHRVSNGRSKTNLVSVPPK